MAFESTITEMDMDAGSQQIVQGFRGDANDYEPDLAVDGMAGGFFAHILSLFGVGRS